MERGFFYRSNHFVNYYIRTIVFIWDSVLSNACAKYRFVQKRDSRLVIHTPRRESVFIYSSNTEVAAVVSCALCGERRFGANLRGFGCGTTRGKPCGEITSFPHTPYTPHSTHCIHNARPQNVDNVGIKKKRVFIRKEGCFFTPFSSSRLQ